MSQNNLTKNQHYVPQFLLRNFGQNVNGDSKLNIFDISRTNIRYNQSIKKNFSENYFYDRDNDVENLLSQDEAAAATVIRNINNGQFSMPDKDRESLIRFIATILFRTRSARTGALSFFDSFTDKVVEKTLELNEYHVDQRPKIVMHPDSVRDLGSLITLGGMLSAPGLHDMNFHFIQNDSNSEFYISDHPAFSYNWLYKDLSDPAVTSLFAKGLQIFFPISPCYLICLYDPKIYKYGMRNDISTKIENAADIEILNSFQVLNSESIIGFQNPNSEMNLKELYRKYGGAKIHQSESQLIKEEELEDEKLRTTHITFVRQAKLSKMPSFVTVKKSSKKDSSSFVERDPKMAQAFYEYMQQGTRH